ncbi:MAG: glycosyltransferase [Candidatus Micrarchaeota archaeon]|nr:glycosyltransferase [Candidatus Micrarchaeota archaeon]
MNIYGSGPEKEILVGLVKKLGIEKNIVFKGYVAEWWKEPFDIYVSTSSSESFSITLSIAAITGRTCVVTDIEAHKEILGSTYPYFFRTYDYKSLAHNLIKIFENRDEAKKIARDIQQRILDDFKNERFQEKVLELISVP